MERIKALLDFARTTPAKLLTKAVAVFNSMVNNPAYPHPPVDMPTFKSGIDRLDTANAAALDGGKQAFAEQKRQVQIVVGMMRDLAHYVESACKGNMETFLSSGFTPAPTTRKQTPPLSEAMRKIVGGPNSGTALVTLRYNPDAYSYELRWRPADATDDVWAAKPAVNTRPAILIKNLTPGTTYIFQARIVKENSHSDWSDSVT